MVGLASVIELPFLLAWPLTVEIRPCRPVMPDALPLRSDATADDTVSPIFASGAETVLHSAGLPLAASAAKRISRLMNSAAAPAFRNALMRPFAPFWKAPAR